jgi:hypothetical protein
MSVGTVFRPYLVFSYEGFGFNYKPLVKIREEDTYIHTYIDIYLLTYLLTAWSRVLLENLTGLHLVKKFPAFYVTRKSITAFTNARQLSLSLSSSIRSIPSHPTS